MQFPNDRPHADPEDNPLRVLTPEQFAALGGSAVAFVREIKGHELAPILDEEGLAQDQSAYQLIMSADGQPLLVTDSSEAVHEWLAERRVGVVTRH